tara:strand:+ start:51 stop:299 length:249 start_codon:yes stop_codon:yes gene_type:complete
MNNMPTYNKDKPLEIYVEQLSFTISSLSEEIIKANDKILKLHEMMDNCIVYVLKNKNDRYITDAEKRMEYKEHEEFIAGGTD